MCLGVSSNSRNMFVNNVDLNPPIECRKRYDEARFRLIPQYSRSVSHKIRHKSNPVIIVLLHCLTENHNHNVNENLLQVHLKSCKEKVNKPRHIRWKEKLCCKLCSNPCETRPEVSNMYKLYGLFFSYSWTTLVHWWHIHLSISSCHWLLLFTGNW